MDIGKGTELHGLDVDRLDVVDKPATKRAFLLMKTEDGDKKDKVEKQVPHQEPDAPKPPIYESMAKSVLDVFADAGNLTKAQADSLDALAKGMGAGHKYKATEKAGMPYDDESKKKPGDAAQSDIPGMMKAVKETGTQVEQLTKSVADLGGMVEKLGGMVEKSVVQKAEAEKKDPPKSTQGKDDDGKKPVVKKVGEGLFTSAIFPDAK